MARAGATSRPGRPLRRHSKDELHARPGGPRAPARPPRRASSHSRGHRTPSGRSRTNGQDPRSSRTTRALSPGSTPSTTPRTGRSTSHAAGSGRPDLLAVQVLRPAPRPGVRPRRAATSAGGRTRSGRPPTSRSGTASRRARSPHELLAGFVAAVDYVRSIGFEAIVGLRARARRSGSLTGLPDSRAGSTGFPTMDGRVATFSVHGRRPDSPRSQVAERLGEARPSRSGTGTTTPSRSCGGSGWPRWALSESGSCTTTRPRKSTGRSRHSLSYR